MKTTNEEKKMEAVSSSLQSSTNGCEDMPLTPASQWHK